MWAAEMLKKKGIDARVLNMSTIKPIDRDTILRAARETKGIVSCEEHSIIGGLGSAVAEALAEGASRRVPLKRIGVADTFGESGTADELLEKHGLTAQNIAATASALLERR